MSEKVLTAERLAEMRETAEWAVPTGTRTELLAHIDAQQAEIDRLTTDKNGLIAEYGQFKEEQRNERSKLYAERERLAAQVAALREALEAVLHPHFGTAGYEHLLTDD